MRTLYLETNMGCAGDMLMEALSELVDQQAFIRKMNEIGLEGVSFQCTPSVKNGISGTHMEVLVNGKEEEDHDHEHDHEHHHEHHHGMHISEIEALIESLAVSDKVKKQAVEIYHLLAEAESRVHQMPVSEVHFHEVGMKDAVADIVGNCVLIEMLQPDHIYASAPATGKGTVMCAHGLLPVPAPATAELLKGIPNYAGKEEGELLTPTGAALLKYFIEKFEDRPAMNYQKIGYGMGKKDFQQANCLRAYLSDESEEDTISELACNIDDETAEEIASANEVVPEETDN